MALNFLNMLAQSVGLAPQGGLQPLGTRPADIPDDWIINDEGQWGPPLGDGITVTGQIDPIAQAALPSQEFADAGRPGQIAQPRYVERDVTPDDPLPVDPNDRALLDRRHMIFEAQEAQRKAAAEAAGYDYKPRQQKSGKEFKANPRLQFGTTGVARDIIGNTVDFFGSLIGRRPTYRDEKIRDKMYGWDQPGGLEPAINRVMQYDPAAAQEIYKNITGVRTQQANADALNENRLAQAQSRNANILSGIGSRLLAASPEAREREYQRIRPALQRQLDATYGPGVEQAPEMFDLSAAQGWANAGYTGRDVSRERVETMKDLTRQEIAEADRALKRYGIDANNSTRLAAARIAADSRMSIADKDRAYRLLRDETRPVRIGQSEDIISGDTSYTYDAAGNVVRPRQPAPVRRRWNPATGRLE